MVKKEESSFSGDKSNSLLTQENVVLENPVIEESKEKKVDEKELLFVDEKKIKFIPAGSVSFPCPNCGKSVISRTFNERRLATPYKCQKCGFVGPN